MENDSILISVSKAAKLLGVHPDTLLKWDNSGKFIALRTAGGHRRYRISEIERFLEDSNGRAKNRMEKYGISI